MKQRIQSIGPSLAGAWAGALLLLLLVVVVGLVGVCEAGVGVWLDDGNGRTVLADELDSQEAAELAQGILDVLDLPAPRANGGRHGHHHLRPHRAHGSAPTWLRGVYETLDEHGHATSTNMDATHRETVTAADTIITFVSRGQRDVCVMPI